MLFRAKTTAIAVTAAACVLLAPTAMASSHPPVQVTGTKLKSGLLPPSAFQPHYVTIFAGNSGGRLEHGVSRRIPPMRCFIFWASIGVDKGYGETAFATEMAGSKTGADPVEQVFQQSVYQFASSRSAASFYGQISAKYKSCRSVSEPDGHGGTLRETVHARSAPRVGGHKSLLLIQYLTDTKIGGPPLVTYELWTPVGTDVYMVSSQLLNVRSPRPTLSSLMLKLIKRISALR